MVSSMLLSSPIYEDFQLNIRVPTRQTARSNSAPCALFHSLSLCYPHTRLPLSICRLRQLAPSYSVTRTEYTAGTSVSVELATSFLGYLPEHVMAANGHWPFGYRVKVTNTGNKVVQLVSRHWLFESADGRVIEVPKGSAGVVGHAPVLEPGQAFEYYSGTQLSTRSGSVRGSFTMVVGATDERFEAKIAPTALMGPPERVAAGQESLAGKATVNA